MPDRHWSHGLNLMVEVKEGCVSTGEKKSLASISFQRFFRQYALVCGMSGTVREVAAELHAGLWAEARLDRPAPAPAPHGRDPPHVSRSRLALERGGKDRGGLAGARPAGAGRRAQRARGGPRQRRADGGGRRASRPQRRAGGAEAEIVAGAGQRGAVSVVTNMAGRGTDIRLGEGVADLGGLVVLICERHNSRRVDRQLTGRCARQGDPGVVMGLVTPEDGVLRLLPPWGTGWRGAGRACCRSRFPGRSSGRSPVTGRRGCNCCGATNNWRG